MLLLTESVISTILTTLTPPQFSHIQDSLDSALASLTHQRSSPPDSNNVKFHQPPRIHFTTPDSATTLVMPSSDSTLTAVKTVATSPGRPPLGAVTLFSPVGELQAVLNAAALTGFRTALVTSCALRYAIRTGLWREPEDGGAKVVVFGSGTQAYWHTLLVVRTTKVGRVTLVNRGRERAEEAGRSWLREVGVDTEVVVQEGNDRYEKDLARALGEADVLIGTLPCAEPLFGYELLKGREGRFVGLIGSYKPSMKEVDTETLLSGGKVLVDSVEDSLIESGEIIAAGLGKEQLIELGAALGDKEPPSGIGKKGNVVFKCVGGALQDHTVAKAVVELAEQLGKGARIDDF
ncbi:NAD(P)-binding protein [Myriangium duriaei CBS 260.36]|uniref:NAD(P)-binding protein n=1 Tax=Myriangium duriaei CBS 260.36 TaxID=1168546 RepID=A0A9P4MEW4_9PEZI|nr:NAD(P)-binding protein [Myriangium duriaei CBS 260.36]